MVQYDGIFEGGPHHGRRYIGNTPRRAVPILEDGSLISLDKEQKEQDLIAAKVGHYVYVPAHWKWIPPE